jgi:hypothetical protein
MSAALADDLHFPHEGIRRILVLVVDRSLMVYAEWLNFPGPAVVVYPELDNDSIPICSQEHLS